jgi:prepilin-type N-terminal cleavage/methylation domain-containing protein
MSARHTRRARAGHSLIEMLLVLAILGVVGGAVALVGLTGEDAFRAETVRTALDGQAREVLGRLTRELRGSSSGSISALPQSPAWDTNLNFDQPSSIAPTTGAIVWRSMRLELRYEQGELDDGLDNNGNGLVDEGRVVLLRGWGEADEQAVVLVHGVREYLEGESFNGLDDNANGLVDERGLSFERDGDTVTVRLSLECRDSDGHPSVRSAETSALLRN